MHLGISISGLYFIFIYTIIGLISKRAEELIVLVVVASFLYWAICWKFVFLRSERYMENSRAKDFLLGSMTFCGSLVLFSGTVFPYNGNMFGLFIISVVFFGMSHAIVQSAFQSFWLK